MAQDIGGFPMGAMEVLAPTLFRQYIYKLKVANSEIFKILPHNL